MSKCIFCKQEGALTREHVIPNWLCTIYPSQEMVINEFVGDNHKQWVSKVFQHKARIVCSTCNSGWMSELEQTSKPLITKMLNLETVVLNEKEQNTLSFWAQKTFLMLNQSIPNGLKITQDTFDDIYSKKSYSKKELVNLGWRMNFQGDKKNPMARSRIAAQIVSGIGFLGAGLILKDGTNVRNLTTAASIWLSGAIGMAYGFNFHGMGLILTAASALIPRIPHINKKYKKTDQ